MGTRFAVRHPVACVLAWLFLLALALGANARTFALRGGILDDALPESNAFRRMDEYVRAKAPAGFDAGEIVPLVVRLPEPTAEHLRFVIEVTREAKRAFGKGVMSLATIPDYRDDGATLRADPYLTEESLAALDVEALRRRVESDATVAGVFVAKDWSWASVAIFLPRGYDEVAVAWQIAEFLEGREISGWERFFRGDVEPRDPRLSVVGWVMGRWQIGQGINRDLMLLVALGVVVSLPISWWYLRSLRQALVCAAVIACGILFTRASIWVLHSLGFGTYERVYTELAYANVIVQGTSFTLHIFEGFRESRARTAGERFLDAARIVGEIRLVVAIAIVGFSCLFTFPVWQMREMAIQSITGVAILYAETVVLLPALYLTLERALGAEPDRGHYHPAQSGFARIVARLRAPAAVAWVVPPLVFAIGAALFANGAIVTKTLPKQYIAGTRIDRTFDLLARSGTGNEFLDVFLEPKDGTIASVSFLDAAWALERALEPNGTFERWQRAEGLEPVGVHAVGSILGKVHQIAHESYGRDMPGTDEEAEDALYLLADELPLEVRRQLWFDGGLRLLVSAEMNDSHALRALVDRLLRFANEEHGERLSARVFGKAPVYPQVDLAITAGEATNVLTSLTLIFGVYSLWIAWRRRALAIGDRVRVLVGGWVMIAPFVFSAGVMAILMAALGVPLSMSTAPIADLAINAAGDFSVYFFSAFLAAFAHRRVLAEAVERTHVRESIVVFVDCALNVIAFSPLLLSGFKPVRELGWMMAAMLVSTLLGILCFVPSLLPATIRPEKETRS